MQIDINGGTPPYEVKYTTNEYFGVAGTVNFTNNQAAVFPTTPSLAGKLLSFTLEKDYYCTTSATTHPVKLWSAPTAYLAQKNLVYVVEFIAKS